METPLVRDPEPTGEIAVALTLSTTLPEGRSLVMQTYLPRDADVGEFHKCLDKLGSAADRQAAKYKLEGLRAALDVHEQTLKQMQEDFANIDVKAERIWKERNKKGPPVLGPNEAAAKGNAEQNMKRWAHEIVKLKTEIAQCEAVLKG
jgi:hypothetical protein